MPEDCTITPASADEPQFSENDIDAALGRVLDRAAVESTADCEGLNDDPDDLSPEYSAGLIDGARQFHQYLLRER